jgi:hypothetical protein
MADYSLYLGPGSYGRGVKMWKSSVAFGICMILSFSLAITALAQTPNEKYLTGADIEKAIGMKGVKLIPRGTAAGAGGDLNFVDASGELILMIQFTDAKNFGGFKSKYSKETVSGIGDQAIQGAAMPGMPDNLLAFTKGTHCVVLTAFGDFVKKKIYLTVDQLFTLGKLIASRL